MHNFKYELFVLYEKKRKIYLKNYSNHITQQK